MKKVIIAAFLVFAAVCFIVWGLPSAEKNQTNSRGKIEIVENKIVVYDKIDGTNRVLEGDMKSPIEITKTQNFAWITVWIPEAGTNTSNKSAVAELNLSKKEDNKMLLDLSQLLSKKGNLVANYFVTNISNTMIDTKNEVTVYIY